jgi:hypothetical protein
MKKQEKQDSFWITNITKKAVHLDDIGVIIYPMRSINLLDGRHYSLTRAQLEKSQTSGTLFTKKKKVVVRKVAPGIEAPKPLPFKQDAIYPTKHRSSVELDNIKYEELDVPDDVYATENADTAQTDHLGKWNNK